MFHVLFHSVARFSADWADKVPIVQVDVVVEAVTVPENPFTDFTLENTLRQARLVQQLVDRFLLHRSKSRVANPTQELHAMLVQLVIIQLSRAGERILAYPTPSNHIAV